MLILGVIVCAGFACHNCCSVSVFCMYVCCCSVCLLRFPRETGRLSLCFCPHVLIEIVAVRSRHYSTLAVLHTCLVVGVIIVFYAVLQLCRNILCVALCHDGVSISVSCIYLSFRCACLYAKYQSVFCVLLTLSRAVCVYLLNAFVSLLVTVIVCFL